jgi:hypothetical protein
MALLGIGTTLGHATTSGGTYTTIAAVTEVKPPETEAQSVEITSYDSADIKEYMCGLDEPGETDFTLNFDKTVYAALMGLRRTSLFWKITLPDDSTYAFEGWITKIGTAIPVGDRLTASATIKVNSVVTFTAGS